ncbi:MAG: BsaWI family type II restriction enzyme [Candidatus Nitrosocaldus sp.]
MGIDEESARERQSRVGRAGGRWEEYVRLYLEERLKDTGIQIIYGKENSIKSNRPSLWKRLALPSHGFKGSIWGDIDLVAVKNDDMPITIISCKVSLHGRFTETLFWSLLYRMLTRIRVVLVTPDAGRGKEGEWISEWGSPTQPTKDRMLAEMFLDGVYIENVKAWCKNIKHGQGTVLGGIVRALHELPDDIKRWAEDAKFY